MSERRGVSRLDGGLKHNISLKEFSARRSALLPLIRTMEDAADRAAALGLPTIQYLLQVAVAEAVSALYDYTSRHAGK